MYMRTQHITHTRISNCFFQKEKKRKCCGYIYSPFSRSLPLSCRWRFNQNNKTQQRLTKEEEVVFSFMYRFLKKKENNTDSKLVQSQEQNVKRYNIAQCSKEDSFSKPPRLVDRWYKGRFGELVLPPKCSFEMSVGGFERVSLLYVQSVQVGREEVRGKVPDACP